MAMHPIHAQRVPTLQHLTQRAAELQSKARWERDSEAKAALLGLSQVYVKRAIRIELQQVRHAR